MYQVLPDLIPQLLKAMKYSKADLAAIIKDSPNDIRYSDAEQMLKGDTEEELEEKDEENNIEGNFH
jgi:hypothetical protein